MTLMEEAKKGNATLEMKEVAEYENMPINDIIKGIANGIIVIPKNINRNTKCFGIGKGMSTKVNANIGSSAKNENFDFEVEKAKIAVEYGAHAVMDLSTGPNLLELRKKIINNIDFPIGTVPIYEAAVTAKNRDGKVIDMTEDDMFNAIENQAKDGVDFITVHCGINRDLVEKIKNSERIMGVVSRGGSFLTAWIIQNELENPLYANYDYLLEIAHEYDMTLSLGDGLRPGCLADATDIPQIQELVTLGTLVKRAQSANVQSMVEGPGHVPYNQIASNMEIQKTLCFGAPFYVLGPIVTDLAPGYDHLTSAIGGTLAAYSGADFLCYVTPSEHLALPDLEAVKEGVIASKIAAQAADVALGNKNAWQKELEMANARYNFDWDKQFELSFDSKKAKNLKESCPVEDEEVCSMCGEYCALKLVKNLM